MTNRPNSNPRTSQDQTAPAPQLAKNAEFVQEAKNKDFLNDILILSQKSENLPLYLNQVVHLVKSYFQADAVGIRLLDDEGNIPYEAYEGFPESFYQSESPLSIKTDRCMCIYVIKRTIDPKAPFVTEKGSFYMNGTSAFLAGVSEQDKGETRNVCNDYGYESVALVPLRDNGNIIGLVHVADHRENQVPFEKLEALEKASLFLGTAIQKIRALNAEKELHKIQWLLTKRTRLGDETPNVAQPYGDLGDLNRDGLIKNSVEKSVLADIVNDFMELLDTSAAIYEKNGDYAYGLFTSGWCRFLDNASRNLCRTPDNREALACGKWFCHESCWNCASLPAIESGLPVDIACDGGIRIYTVPIKIGARVIGAINFGYSDPPLSQPSLQQIADRYQVDIEELRRRAEEYESRPQYIIDVAKNRLHSSARLIAALVEQKQTQRALCEQRDRARQYLDIAAVMIIALDRTGAISLINRRGSEILGRREEELLGLNWFDHCLPHENRENIKHIFHEIISGNSEMHGYVEGHVLCSDGRRKLIAWHNTVVRDERGRIIATLSSGTDITEKKEIEQQMLSYQKQLQMLVSQLTAAEEKERKRIATLLHDQIGQTLVFAKMKVEMFHQEQHDDRLRQELAAIKDRLGMILSEAQTLINDLGTPALYELGLLNAITDFLNDQLYNHHQITSELNSDGSEALFDTDMSVFIYRTVRELLVNVVKYAHATHVTVSLHRRAGFVHVTVTDNGRGFAGQPPSDKGSGFGLFSIRERLHVLGGELDIASGPDSGARVTIKIPVTILKSQIPEP